MRIVITYRHGGDDQYLDLIKMAFASAQRLGYSTVLIGDIAAGDMRWKPAIDKDEHLMNWVLAAQLNYIQSSLFDQNTVIFSPDALITRPLEEVFELDFDVAFTNRKNSRWPINNGVIYLKPENKTKIADFWNSAIAMCKSYSVETQKWFGDQQSLHDVYVRGDHLRIGLKAELLPCAIYNASPVIDINIDTELLKSAYIVHLKGNRKTMMKEYWEHLCSIPL